MRHGSLRVIRVPPSLGAIRQALQEFESAGGSLACGLSNEGVARLRAAYSGGRIEITDLERFAATLLTQSSSEVRQLMDPSLELEVVAHACEKIAPSSVFAPHFFSEGFQTRALKTLHELASCRIGSPELRQVAVSVDDVFSSKLTSLADLYDAFLEATSLLGRETSFQRLNRLREGPPPPSLEGPLLVGVFCDENPLNLEVVRKLTEWGSNLTVMIEGNRDSETVFGYSEAVAKSLSAPIQDLQATPTLGSSLFTNLIYKGSSPAVTIVSSSDPLAEVEWALRDAKSSGFDQTVIYARDGSYLQLLDAVTKMYGVPLQAELSLPLAEMPWVRSLLLVIRSLLDGPQALSDALSSGRVCNPQMIPPSNLSALEMAGASGYGGIDSDPKSPLGEIIAWRARALETRHSLGDWVELLGALASLQVFSVPEDSVAPQAAAARDALLDSYRRFALVRSLTSDGGASLGEFASQLHDLAESRRARLPNRSEDGLVVRTSSVALGECPNLIVLGMLEGVFPKRRSEDPILSDFEREYLNSALGLEEGFKSSYEIARNERDAFVRICNAATGRLVLSYPQADDDRDNVPTFYLEEIKRAYEGRVALIDRPRGAAPEAPNCVFDLDRDVALGFDEGPEPLDPTEWILDASRVQFTIDPDEEVSVRQLRDGLECGFKLRFGSTELDRNDPRAEVHRALLSLPQTTGLPLQPNPDEARRALERAFANIVASSARRLRPSERKLIEEEARTYFRNWVRSEFLSRELWPKDPGSTVIHASFGHPGLAGFLNLKGVGGVTLRGGLTGYARMGRYAVGILHSARSSLVLSTDVEKMEEPERLELAAYLWSLSEGSSFVALEAMSIGGDRTLFVCPRLSDQNLRADQANGLRVVDLGTLAEFLPPAKDLIRFSARRMREADIVPAPGKACKFCRWGELCRSSAEFLDDPDDGGARDAS